MSVTRLLQGRMFRWSGLAMLWCGVCQTVWSGPILSGGFSSAPPAEAARADQLNAARSCFDRGDYEGCWTQLEALVREQPERAPAGVLLASWFLEAGQPALARQVLERAVVKAPHEPGLYLAFGDLALREGRLTDAELQLTRALELATANSDRAKPALWCESQSRQGLSHVAEARGDWEVARTHLTASLQCESGRADLRQRLGRACYHLGRIDEAAAELEQAAKMDETAEPASIIMARLYTQDAEFAEAEEWLQRGIAAHPGDSRIRFAYATWLLDQDRPEEALRQSESLRMPDETARDWQLLTALIARRLQDYARAEEVLEELYRDDPREFQIINQLALVLAEQPDPQKQSRALQLAEVSCRLFPSLSAAQATLGCVLHRLNRLSDAELAFSAAAAGGPMNSDAAYHLACVLAAQGKRPEAVRVLQGAIQATGPFYLRRNSESLLKQLSATQ